MEFGLKVIYNDGGMNACAYHDGVLKIDSGALKTFNDDEVAFILAHELSHVIQGHSAKANVFYNRFIHHNVWSMILEIEPTYPNRESELNFHLYKSTEELLKFYAKKRANEFEADKLGCYIMWWAGFRKWACVEYEEKKLKQDRGYIKSTKDPLWDTHPPHAARISNIIQAIEEQDAIDREAARQQAESEANGIWNWQTFKLPSWRLNEAVNDQESKDNTIPATPDKATDSATKLSSQEKSQTPSSGPGHLVKASRASTLPQSPPKKPIKFISSKLTTQK